WVERRARDRVIAAIGPIEQACVAVDLEIDRFRQIREQHLDVLARRRRRACRHLEARALDRALAGVVAALLRPIELAAARIDRNADAPAALILAVRIAGSREDERFD